MCRVDSPPVWSSFPLDPRDPAHATLRASDADREVVHQVLAQAYADGRLDHAEHEERSAAVTAARTLGELPPLVADLVPAVLTRRRAGSDLTLATPTQLRARAEEAWRRDRNEAVGAFVLPTLICLVVYLLTSFPGHPWPVWVALGTGINLAQTLARRGAIVEEHTRKLEKKQARELRKRELEP